MGSYFGNCTSVFHLFWIRKWFRSLFLLFFIWVWSMDHIIWGIAVSLSHISTKMLKKVKLEPETYFWLKSLTIVQFRIPLISWFFQSCCIIWCCNKFINCICCFSNFRCHFTGQIFWKFFEKLNNVACRDWIIFNILCTVNWY